MSPVQSSQKDDIGYDLPAYPAPRSVMGDNQSEVRMQRLVQKTGGQQKNTKILMSKIENTKSKQMNTWKGSDMEMKIVLDIILKMKMLEMDNIEGEESDQAAANMGQGVNEL